MSAVRWTENVLSAETITSRVRYVKEYRTPEHGLSPLGFQMACGRQSLKLSFYIRLLLSLVNQVRIIPVSHSVIVTGHLNKRDWGPK